MIPRYYLLCCSLAIAGRERHNDGLPSEASRIINPYAKGDPIMTTLLLAVAVCLGMAFPSASFAGETSATMEKMKGETKAMGEEVKGTSKGAVEDAKGNKTAAEVERTKGKVKAEEERAKGNAKSMVEKAK
jgi:hypothetical protein